jgi:hypothetical protein
MCKTPEPEFPGCPVESLEGGSPVVKKAREGTRRRAVEGARRSRSSKIHDEEERILREATQHLIRKHGGLFVATRLRKEPGEGIPRWIITVTLRYPTGHEGDVGDLLYDGHAFTFLTDPSLIDERVRQIAADPEHMRKWNEYRDSTLPAREA